MDDERAQREAELAGRIISGAENGEGRDDRDDRDDDEFMSEGEAEEYFINQTINFGDHFRVTIKV